MKFLITATTVAFLSLIGAGVASADPIETGIGTNPGLANACAFNRAFASAHGAACVGIDVEAVASNGGNFPE